LASRIEVCTQTSVVTPEDKMGDAAFFEDVRNFGRVEHAFARLVDDDLAGRGPETALKIGFRPISQRRKAASYCLGLA
jgi:hypothetical protein